MMNAQSVNVANDQAYFLRRALRGNGIFSVISGLVLILAAAPIAAFMGLEFPVALVVVGVVLLPFAAVLFWVTSQTILDRNFARTAITLDIAWVIGSILILLIGQPPLTVAGKWTVALLAEAVATFAVLQAYGLRRMNKAISLTNH